MLSSHQSRLLTFVAAFSPPISATGGHYLAGIYEPLYLHQEALWAIVFCVAAVALTAFALYGPNERFLVRRIDSISIAMKNFVTTGFREYSLKYPEPRKADFFPSLRPLSSIGRALDGLVGNADLMVSAIAESKRGMLEREKNHLLWIEFLSHDLASPLARISKRLDVLEYDASVTSEQKERFFALAHLEIMQLTEMLGSVNQIASLESDVERNFVEISLEPLLQQVIDVYEFDACQKRIKIKRQLDADLIVRVEKTLIRRALGNLISNAICYTHEGGEISIHSEEDGRTIRISVRDSGIGIPPHELSRIFEFGFRGDGQSRPASLGPRGVGLALVQKVVELHHGEVTAENLEPHGTEFVISLPIEG